MEELPQSHPALSSALPQGVRRVVAVGGGRPGVGHSVLSTNLAVYLAQLGRKVVLVDSDPAGPALHAMLDMEVPEQDAAPDPLAPEELRPVPTAVPGLSLLPQRYLPGTTVPLRPGRKPRWAKGLRNLDADYIILDLGAGTAPATLDLFLGADFGICITAPDPPSIESSYRFLKALFQRQVKRLLLKDRFKMRMFERALAQLPPLPAPIELLRTLSRYDAATAESAASQLASLRTYLVTNNTRLRHDVELGRAMTDLAERYLGVNIAELGHVEHDDAIWLSVVRRRPLLIDNPTSKSARNLERVARRVVAIATSRELGQRPVPAYDDSRQRSLYEVLWTHRGASDEDLRRAYKRQKEVFEKGSLPLSSLLSEEERQKVRSRLEEAQETLLDPVRRRSYDLSFFPEEADTDVDVSPERDEAGEAERAMLRQELAHEIHSETEFTGELLRRVRESHGIELAEVSRKTKIGKAHLEAIEAEDFDKLPAEVYTRGFVQQLSQLLGLDATQATRTFLRRYRTHKKSIVRDKRS